jgi:hypothetical protein
LFLPLRHFFCLFTLYFSAYFLLSKLPTQPLNTSFSIIIKNMKKKTNKVSKFLFWTPRIISILFILFLSLFSLDVFDGNYGFWGTILALLMHNIPVFFLIIILIISWRYEIVGGIVFTLAGLLYVARLLMTIIMHSPHEWYMLFWTLPISGPAFLVGMLFFINWFQKRK